MNVPESPPCNIELEQALLGAILTDNRAFGHVAFLEPHHFSETTHQKIFEVAASQLRAGKFVNPLTIRPHIPADQEIVPGLTASQYLARLAAEAPSVLCAPDYAKGILELSRRRSAFFWGKELQTAATKGDDVAAILDEAQAEIKTHARAPTLKWLEMSQWDGEQVPERLWAIPDRVPLNQAGLFSGEGGTGKSIIELQKNVAHVTGKMDWLGSLPVCGPAFYIGAEDDAREIHIRLAAIARWCGVSFADLIRDGLHVLPLLGQDATLCHVGKSGRIETTALYKQVYEAAGDIKPKNISVDTLSRAFAGSEIDRVQVYGFAQHMQALAMVAGGSVTILSHPSLSGINSGSGISGSTAWHGAFRFRQYLTSTKPEAGEQPDNDLRQLEFKKNQYGPTGETIVLQYRNGLFLPVAGASNIEKAAADQRADDVFLALLARYSRENRVVASRPCQIYAPALFANESEAKTARVNGKQLEVAMGRLFKAEKIINELSGPPSRQRSRLMLK